MKVCSRCGVEKSLDEYYRKTKDKNSLRYICKPCHKSKSVISSYKSRHGMIQDDVKNIIIKQNGCAICGVTETSNNWQIDHDHSCENCTNRRGSCVSCRRGVLCSKCNTAIGLLDENISVIQSAVKYLEYWKNKSN